jgi:hypothetical protein
VFPTQNSIKTPHKHKQKKRIEKRVSLFNLRKIQKGSLTVEAALVLPIFLFALISILYFGEMIRLSNCCQNSLHQNAKEIATYAYAYKKSINKPVMPGNFIGSYLISNTYIKEKVNQELDEKKVAFFGINGEKEGISYSRSKILEKEMIDLIAVYEIKIPYDFLGIDQFKFVNRARVRAFTGYDNTLSEDISQNEEIVFITPTGNVYHRDRNCKHLNISISKVTAESITNRRNKNGGKYYICEYCGNKQGDGSYYITDYGDRYHKIISCSGLKRDIKAIPISEVNGRSECKTCGK